MKLDVFDITLIAAFFIALIAIIFSSKLGIAADAFKDIEIVLTTALGVFVGKKVPSVLGK